MQIGSLYINGIRTCCLIHLKAQEQVSINSKIKFQYSKQCTEFALRITAGHWKWLLLYYQMFDMQIDSLYIHYAKKVIQLFK